MATKINFRSRVMKYAWQIFRATKLKWSLCMRKAWMLYKLWSKLKEGVVKFAYYKNDGSFRMATGTLHFNGNASYGNKKITKPSYKTLTYFDLGKNAFRCFRVENLANIHLG